MRFLNLRNRFVEPRSCYITRLLGEQRDSNCRRLFLSILRTSHVYVKPKPFAQGKKHGRPNVKKDRPPTFLIKRRSVAPILSLNGSIHPIELLRFVFRKRVDERNFLRFGIANARVQLGGAVAFADESAAENDVRQIRPFRRPV